MIAQRKLESIRVLEALFERIKVICRISVHSSPVCSPDSHFQLKNARIKTKIKSENGGRDVNDKVGDKKSFDLREKLIRKVKSAQEHELERQKNRVKKYKSNTVLGSALEKDMDRSPSMNLISSDESMLSDSTSDSPTERKRKKSENEEPKPSNGETRACCGSINDQAEFNDFASADDYMMQGGYPMMNAESGQWMPVYPYPAPFFAPTHMVRPDMYPGGHMPPFPYRGGYRGRFPRGRGRGGKYRGRGGYYPHDSSYKNGYGDYDDSYDYKRRRDHHKR